MTRLVEQAKAIQVAVAEVRTYEEKKAQVVKGILPPGQKKEELLKLYDEQMQKLRADIEEAVSACYNGINEKSAPKPLPEAPAPMKIEEMAVPRPTAVPSPPAAFSSPKFHNLSKKEKDAYIKELGMKEEELVDFLKYQKIKAKVKVEIKKEDYTIYKPNEYGAVANKYVKKYADRLIKKYPKVFQPLFDQFQRVDMPILSHSYVSVMLFFTIIALPVLLVTFLILNFVFKLNIVLVIVLAFVATLLTLVGFYLYPASLQGERRKKIKKDLPFALVHMSAVAGSGAHPISIFELLVESDEYPELKKEIRKILNYVNLFGYNLSTALRNVAATTASQELKELLNGMVSTIETGGDLKGYLKEKADDALNTYRLDRKKEVEAISTFAEIYTAILIAAPLLFLVTLAIINTIGGQLGGLSVKLLAQIGIFAVLPLLNVGYMVFMKAQSANL